MISWIITKSHMILNNLRAIYSFNKGFLYRVEEIDASLDKVRIFCRWGKGSTITTSIQDIGSDNYIVSHLPPLHASWIGYYYGKKWLKSEVKKKSLTNSVNVNVMNFCSNVKILCKDRSGCILYKNLKTGQMNKEHPHCIASSNKIELFNAKQAYFIGFSAALQPRPTFPKTAVSPPKLALVK